MNSLQPSWGPQASWTKSHFGMLSSLPSVSGSHRIITPSYQNRVPAGNLPGLAFRLERPEVPVAPVVVGLVTIQAPFAHEELASGFVELPLVVGVLAHRSHEDPLSDFPHGLSVDGGFFV